MGLTQYRVSDRAPQADGYLCLWADPAGLASNCSLETQWKREDWLPVVGERTSEWAAVSSDPGCLRVCLSV